MTRPHLLAVWNPTYGRDPMEAHLRVLRQAVRELRAGECGEDDVFVWWGKVRSQNRLQPLPHAAEIAAIDANLDPNADGPETHVYLTDFQSLYVADLGEVTADDPRKDPDEAGRVPEYYTDERLECDFWFRLWDIHRLVGGDLRTVAFELRKLRNLRHDGRPVSLYGGMVDLPLLVAESGEASWFDPENREDLTGGKYWIEYDAEQGGVGEVERNLREHLFGDAVWQAFEPTTRLFLATGEKLWRDNANDAAFDSSPVLLEYCKALEVHCNQLLRRALADAPPALRSRNVDGKSVDATGRRQLTLREIAKLVGGEREVKDHLSKRLEHGTWFTNTLPAVLDALAEFRGPVAHQQAPDRADVARWRQQLCGIGCEGHFVNLAKVKPKPR